MQSNNRLVTQSKIGQQGQQINHNQSQYPTKLRIPNHILQRRNQLQKMMIEAGEMERLEQYLRKKLIAIGWKEDLKSHCKDLIRQKGIQRVTVQYLMQQLQNRGKHMIPVNIKEDMLSRVRKFLEESNNRQRQRP